MKTVLGARWLAGGTYERWLPDAFRAEFGVKSILEQQHNLERLNDAGAGKPSIATASTLRAMTVWHESGSRWQRCALG